MEIHRSVALLIFIHQGVSTPGFCHYGGSRPPPWGGAWEAGDPGRPRTVYSTRGVRTVAECWLGLRVLPSDTQEKRNSTGKLVYLLSQCMWLLRSMQTILRASVSQSQTQ